MGGDPAELAYGHALAMLGDPVAAAEVATTALRRAGRSRALVLAHARQQAVARANEDEPVDLAAVKLLVLDLPALAATLASTRPVEERAALDIRARTGGDLAALGEAIGSRPTVAADRCNEIAEIWERTLDPALLAFSGPGDCEGLAALLDANPPETVADLVAIAPAAQAHAQGCVGCTDRVRAMAPVRSFFSDDATVVPDEVRTAGRVSRTKRPSVAPDPLFPADAVTAGRRSLRPIRVAAVALVVLVAGGTTALLVNRADGGPSVLSRLTKLNKTEALKIDPPDVTGAAATIDVQNPTDHFVAYRATASEGWALIKPARGRIPAHGVARLQVIAGDGAPEGNPHATVTIRTNAGASTVAELVYTVERAPDVAASAVGCDVSVNVVEEGDLKSLVLHWRDTTEHEIDITNGIDGYNAQLAPDGDPITYWVTALDARGNASRTADQSIPANAC